MPEDYFSSRRARRQRRRDRDWDYDQDSEKGSWSSWRRDPEHVPSWNTNPGMGGVIGNGDESGEAGQPFYLTASFWKRFSVFLSISLSIAGLIVSAYASLAHPNEGLSRALTVTGIIINSVSISISALTSLDWKKQVTHDRAFVQQLAKVVGLDPGESLVVVGATGRGNGEERVKRRVF